MNNVIATRIARYVLGAGFFVFGLNFFLHFLPQPPAPPAAMSFAGALFATGYMFPLIKVIEVGAGLMLLANRYVTLALALLAPLLVNIVAFHAFLAPAGLALPIVLLALELYLAWSYRAAYAPMLQTRVTPAQSTAPRLRTADAHA
jgi:putative oxidoreductase